ncbi:hypothetical protein AN958_11529 [Leucoagaricus sp. SymC.cos]|nr:hypothetical protein AN958_11529 [Leucoagaricus sp. SymC.cos]
MLRMWLNSNHDPSVLNLLWLSGPAGVGKSAIARSFAEYCSTIGRLGAAFFIPRAREHASNNFDKFVPTIAYQLALQHAEYKNFIAATLSEDPLILSKGFSTQFLKLIEEPLSHVFDDLLQRPLVIIVDGLEQCGSEKAQL